MLQSFTGETSAQTCTPLWTLFKGDASDFGEAGQIKWYSPTGCSGNAPAQTGLHAAVLWGLWCQQILTGKDYKS